MGRIYELNGYDALFITKDPIHIRRSLVVIVQSIPRPMAHINYCFDNLMEGNRFFTVRRLDQINDRKGKFSKIITSVGFKVL